MKLKTIAKTVGLAGLMLTSLTGCAKNNLELIEIDPYSLTGANHRNLRINGMGYSAEQYTEHTYFDLEEKEVYYKYVIEDVKALVVPVDFTDVSMDVYGGEERVHDILQAAVFGEKEDVAWYSLADYYHTSSFGQCTITGDVLPTWHHNDSVKAIKKAGSKTGIADKIAGNIRNYYAKHQDELPDGNTLADYDANKDGFIDSLIMIYSAPITTTGELFWAFCSSISGAYGRYSEDGKDIGVNRYFWASMKFLYEHARDSSHQDGYYTDTEIASGNVKPDSHTLIHEYGHVLSLPDYYVTDYSTSDYSALGALDMMDYNVGDHNAFSKMMYGWINPRRLAGTSGSITFDMKSTTDTGDTVIIPAPGEWNNTYLDQYLVIEFLTPTGVAKADGETQYLGYYPRYYSKAGIRITQVDARLGVFQYTQAGYVFAGYTWGTRAPESETYSYVNFAADNTASRSCFDDYKLIEILPKLGKTQKERSGAAANDDCLYYAGESFGNNGSFKKFKLNGLDGTKNKAFGFKISVKAIEGNEKATITISR